MTNEKAIKHLNSNEIYTDDWNEAILMAKEALEKQIPKKPNIYDKFEHHCECGAIVKTYQNYCYDCGQALDWSDTE